MSGTSRSNELTKAMRKTLSLSFVLVVGSLGALALHPLAPRSEQVLPWWALAMGFVIAEMLEFHMEIGREAHTFTFSEVPFVVGLLYATPANLVAGRLIGAGAYLLFQRSQTPNKTAFNLSLYLTESTLALFIIDATRGTATIQSPRLWLSVVCAVAVANLTSIIAVVFAIKWHGATPRPGEVLIAGGFTTVTNTALALIGALLLDNNGWALALLCVLALNLCAAYRSYASIAQRLESLELFQDFTRAVGSGLPAEAVIETVLQQARQLLRAEFAQIVVLDADNAEGTPVVCELRGTNDFAVLPRAEQAEARWWATHNPGTSGATCITRSTRNERERAILRGLGVRDCVLAAVHSDSVVVGYLVVGERMSETSSFDDNDTQLLETLANHASVALENGRLIDRLTQAAREREHEAMHDALTGLPNRASFVARVTRALTQRGDGEIVAVLLLDLDRFKEVNDTLGHYSGDLLLCEIARRLLECSRSDSIVARFGGDEFAFAVTGLRTTEEVEVIANRVRDAIGEPIDVGALNLQTDVSIGIAIAPLDGDDISVLMQRADVAMYQAKRDRSGVELYDAEQDRHTVQKLALAGSLRNAIFNGEIVVYYQPKARLSDGAIVGAEALVRWHHATFGVVPPDEFITTAEQSGLIGDLTQLVLDRSLEQLAAWRAKGHELSVAVNISAQNLVDGAFPRSVERLLVRWRVQPQHLTLEITESGVLELQRAQSVLEELRDIGVQLSVDDFGTGYSSLSYLHMLPVQEVKIDRSFVSKLGGGGGEIGIVKAIVDLGHNLGLTVVAEGVEDQITWDRLRALSCDVVQGYYLSRPAQPAILTQWLDDRRTAAGHAVFETEAA